MGATFSGRPSTAGPRHVFSVTVTDSINAMLAPGEYVVNAQSAARFHSQLVALNQGVSPFSTPQADPRQVFGDTHVTINGASGDANELADAVIGRMRQKIRMGTLKL